jgi:glutathione S-transferase
MGFNRRKMEDQRRQAKSTTAAGSGAASVRAELDALHQQHKPQRHADVDVAAARRYRRGDRAAAAFARCREFLLGEAPGVSDCARTEVGRLCCPAAFRRCRAFPRTGAALKSCEWRRAALATVGRAVWASCAARLLSSPVSRVEPIGLDQRTPLRIGAGG